MSVYKVDPSHSHVEFIVRHLMISKVRGSFGTFEIQLEVDDASHLPTSVVAEIDAASIDTKVADRDAHLRSADFFDVEKFPQLTFKSTNVSGSGDEFTVEGDLTIHGVTKRVALTGTFEGSGKDPWGNERVAYTAKTKVNRKDFGLNWNQALEAGGVMVGENVDIELTVEAIKAQTAAAV